MAFATETVTVLHPIDGSPDEMGEPTITWKKEEVEGVLFAPLDAESSSADLDVERPDGTHSIVTFHFPKTFSGSLRGCCIEREGRTWRVIGDPQCYMEENTPGQFWMPARAEVVYG